MIEKKSNININRTVDYSTDSEQINILDTRFYKRNGNYYPSVTSILQCYPKGKFFEDWIKANGYNADIIAAKAAKEGTDTHNAIEKYLKGEEVVWIEKNGYVNFSLDVWKMILRFANFWETTKPELIECEYHLFSDEYKFAGNADLIIKLWDELWILDIKTSNMLHSTYDLQISAYIKAWNETHDIKINKGGVLWLKANTKKEAKTNTSRSGKGWQLKEVENIEKSFDIFTKTYDIYKLENPENKPYSQKLPTKIKLNG
jgi:hypothetical protein